MSDDILNDAPDADLRWARYLQQCSHRHTLHLHRHFDGNGIPPTYAGPSDQQYTSPISHYPAFPSAASRTFRVITWPLCLPLLSILPIEISTVYRSSPLAIDVDRDESLTPTPANVVQQSRKSIAHSPAHSNQVRSPATKRTPPNIPGASTTARDANSPTLWDQTCAAAVQWSALGMVEPNDQNGQSVLMEWIERRPDAFYCKAPTSSGRCKVYNTKKDRILSHVRKDHLNFRPFRCRGVCGTPNW